MRIVQTAGFRRRIKRLHGAGKQALDTAVRTIAGTPDSENVKRGALAGVRVFKFTMKAQQYLLAYKYESAQKTITLLAIGAHENFYRDLKV